uniref:Vitellogenin domain-containing protein n=1 Tax=Panagrolaimus sp. PS1159 TaxID=55785 RepID=A0AC35EXW5_9BILA
EKILALKAIGNAANDLSVINLENVIRDPRHSSIIRIHAIDALRRLRNEMPRKIQRILLPIFKNTMEIPEVRMTAFSMLMATFPEKVILDQITYTLHSERSNHVKSFVVRVYNALSTSVIPEERETAPHLRTALTLANVDLDMSCQYQRIPLYSGESQEGVFLNLASIFSTTDGIPKHLSASLDSLFNGLSEKDTISISLSQQNLEDLYHRF